MSIYECPYCHEKTFNPLTKAFAGAINTKGRACPNCGRKCTNSIGSSIFHTIVDAIVLIAAIVFYVQDIDFGIKISIGGTSFKGSYVLIAGMIVAAFIINKIFDAFFLPLAKSARVDAYQ